MRLRFNKLKLAITMIQLLVIPPTPIKNNSRITAYRMIIIIQIKNKNSHFLCNLHTFNYTNSSNYEEFPEWFKSSLYSLMLTGSLQFSFRTTNSAEELVGV